MILLLRLVTALLATYFIYMVYEWWKDNHSPYVVCPQCEGEGIWITADGHQETCLLCRGAGKIEREI